VLRRQLLALNLHDGLPWLDDERLTQAVAAITHTTLGKLQNNVATGLRLAGFDEGPDAGGRLVCIGHDAVDG
jgi:hypothetical protein